MNCGKCDGGTEILTLFNLNCHMCLAFTVLNSAGLEKSQERIKDHMINKLMEGEMT